LAHPKGAMNFFKTHGVLNKDFKRWAMDPNPQVRVALARE
jgi:hypothetical protein